jgi:hypothetical protein
MSQVSRYHPVLVAVHWLLAALIVAALALGASVTVKIPNSDPMKIEALRSHMTGGVFADACPSHRAHLDHASSSRLNREPIAGRVGPDLASNALCRGVGQTGLTWDGRFSLLFPTAARLGAISSLA